MAASTSLKDALKNPDSIRMFKSDTLERLSHVHPITPFVIYIPLITLAMYWSIFKVQLGLVAILGSFLSGMVLWTIIEYLLHRFLFHIPQTNKVFKAIYFYTHGMHHDKPDDATRLVMPPGASIPLATGFFFLFRWLTPEIYLPLFSGFVLGYVIYDFLHFASHFFKFKNSYFKIIKRNHMIHHYRAPLKNFGFTSPIWDYVGFSVFKRTPADDNLNDRSGLKPL